MAWLPASVYAANYGGYVQFGSATDPNGNATIGLHVAGNGTSFGTLKVTALAGSDLIGQQFAGVPDDERAALLGGTLGALLGVAA